MLSVATHLIHVSVVARVASTAFSVLYADVIER